MPTLFSSPKPAPVPTPKTMPTMDDAAIQAAERQKQAALMAQSGRASTIYSQNSNNSNNSFGG